MFAALFGLVPAGPASAHIRVEPSRAKAGQTVSLAFTIQHGCGSSPTTSLRMRVPTGVVVLAAPGGTRWTTRIARSAGGPTEVAWTGLLAADQADRIALQVRLPAVTGTLRFPFVQNCRVGVLRWIEPDGSHPSPALRVLPAS